MFRRTRSSKAETIALYASAQVHGTKYLISLQMVPGIHSYYYTNVAALALTREPRTHGGLRWARRSWVRRKIAPGVLMVIACRLAKTCEAAPLCPPASYNNTLYGAN